MALTKVSNSMITGAVINVLDYGADNTGTTDSYAAITAAIAAVGEAGIVYFPAGVYKTSNTISISDATTDHFITLMGDGMEATWLVHTGTQTTGCVKITGTVYFNAAAVGYYPNNNGSSQVCNMALGSNYGPGLYCQYANKMRHNNVFIYSAGASSYSLYIESCIESYFENVYASTGNDTVPVDLYDLVKAGLPTGDVTVPLSNIFTENGTYNDGTHGSYSVANGELFFSLCRTDGGCTDNSVDIRGAATSTMTETFIAKFDQCKFTGAPWINTDPSPWVVNINGANKVSFFQCMMEPQIGPLGQVGGSLRISSNLASASVFLEDCYQESAGLVDIGIYAMSADPNPISCTITNSTFYQVRVSPYAITNNVLKDIIIQNNHFGANLGSGFNSIVNVGPTLVGVQNYQVSGNSYGDTYLPCSYQTCNNSGFNTPVIHDKLYLDFLCLGSTLAATPAITLANAAPTTGTWRQGSVVFNSSATVGQPKGWQCTVDGTPGTWVSMGNL